MDPMREPTAPSRCPVRSIYIKKASTPCIRRARLTIRSLVTLIHLIVETDCAAMGSERLPLRQCGIYRNLPDFDPSIKGLRAIVVGATGISGFGALRSLLDAPQRWSTVYALSRSPLSPGMQSVLTQEQLSHVQHVSVDLTGTANDIAASLREAKVQADYVFFFAYMHPKGKSAMDPSMAEALVETNAPIFSNFVTALDLANITPKRILLQTGGKNYGAHIGRARTPYVESDPQPKHLSDNFYYHQEDALFKYCEQHPTTHWNTVRPFGIIGAVPAAGMNTMLPFAVMAATQAKKGEPIFFGGDIDEWQYEEAFSSARLTGYLCEWAVLEDKCEDQAFNAVDGCNMSWDRFFEELARWYGVEAGIQGPKLDESKFSTIKLAGGKESPMGYGPPPALRVSWTLADWAQDPVNARTWQTIIEESKGQMTTNLFESGFDVSTTEFAFYKIGQPSMAKLRRFGFNGFVDTVESVFEMYQDLAKMGLVPPPKVEAARPMV